MKNAQLNYTAELVEKAEVLIEALPRIRRLYGKTIVVKYGGAAMASDDLKAAVTQDLALMKFVGMNPVVVHGGGPEISAVMERMGKKATFVDGLRVTDQETMEIVQMALVGKINREVVALLSMHGGKGVGLSGHDAGLIRADRHEHTSLRTGDAVDLGFVGDVAAIEPGVVKTLMDSGYIPVIAPIGVGSDGQTYNINADTAAGAFAAALKAEKLILLTDVEGVCKDCDDPNTVIPKMSAREIRKAIDDGWLAGGMVPKVEACLQALKAGVKQVFITDGRIPHALLLEMFADQPLGTIAVARDE